ncbi:hypothetical protein C1J03_20525 [Sulfitobacter sp. SK012]|uniref:TIGR00180 family glycosyltransferase n=1 Tax=Sulfitobacter sp. SK012 TaxID=1389005 RepID=UPI000E0B8581|nr:TIGR00180 family glycosyltransferase [Sulfitobacter sp. SK012]AXI48174.1 hypothetical protein C1J03_20525 [Sulfitobacter sp. SK012]
MRIIIPTRNRPTSLSGVLGYYEKFYPDVEIILADGSDAAFKPLNAKLAAEASIEIDYQPYSSDLSLFDRLLEVLKSAPDEYLIMAADDDYPIMETMERAKHRLEQDPDAVCAGGYLIHIDVLDEKNARVRLDPVRQIAPPTAGQRIRLFGQLPFTTTYAVARRERLIARYQFLQSWNVPGFFDLGVGMMDMAEGKFIAIPDLGFICTRNLVHSYYRSEDNMVVLRRGPEVMQLIDKTTARLQEVDDIDEEAARRVIGQVVRSRIAALSGVPPARISGFTERPLYNTERMVRTRADFKSIFVGGTEQRKKYHEKLAFISESLRATLISQDNAGEGKKYEAL